MTGPAKPGLSIVGMMFLLLAVSKFLDHGHWVVWAILGFLFGGFGIFNLNRTGERSK